MNKVPLAAQRRPCSWDGLLKMEAQRIVDMFPERRAPLEVLPFVKTDGLVLVHARFEPEHGPVVSPDGLGQMVQPPFCEAQAAELGTGVHALEFSIFRHIELDPDAAGGAAIVARHQEWDSLSEGFPNAVSVSASLGVHEAQGCFPFADQWNGSWSIRGFPSNEGGHRDLAGDA
jgi:hypothetical protein